eukprot:CAMPEP_0118938112 /NCGR_PEP_ID=MMETSP1169-20130426/24797_1 /TAXON_ID=36882 /ORGANISM="Pyramimonas obovata, Strain CCMP722" /LENGTH=39 /DNA_ID= /DNA_START= /DNA_END= /DNA_ORIENTATION=
MSDDGMIDDGMIDDGMLKAKRYSATPDMTQGVRTEPRTV